MLDTSKFPYPSQWGEASDFWSNLVQQGGMPTDIEPWWQAQQQAAGEQITRSGKEAAEQFGLGGMRYSSGLGQQLGRIGAETTAGIMPQYWAMGMGAQESAKGRAMTGAQALQGLGGEYFRAPFEAGERTLGISGELQRQQMASMYPALAEMNRMYPENNPYLQMGQQFPYGQFGQQPQMYQQSPFSQMLGAGASVAPWLINPAGAAAGTAAGAATGGTDYSNWNPWGG